MSTEDARTIHEETATGRNQSTMVTCGLLWGAGTGAIFSVFGTVTFLAGGKFVPEIPCAVAGLMLAVVLPGFLRAFLTEVQRSGYAMLLILFLALFGVGYLAHGDAVSAYQDVRAATIAVTMACLFSVLRSRYDEFATPALLTMALSSVFLSIWYFFSSGLLWMEKCNFSAFAILSAVFICFMRFGRMYGLAAVGIMLGPALVSGFRIHFLTLVIGAILGTAIGGGKGVASRARHGVVTVMCGAALLGCVYLGARWAVENQDVEDVFRPYPVLHGQFYLKTKLLLSPSAADEFGGEASAQGRLTMLGEPFKDPMAYLLPKGFGVWAHYEQEGRADWHPMDNGLMGVIFIGGWLLTIPFFLALGATASSSLNGLRGASMELFRRYAIAVGLFCIAYVVFIGGTVYLQPVHSSFFGAAIGYFVIGPCRWADLTYRSAPQRGSR